MRVIAGSARGRRLKAPPGRATRPTSDRVREALFSSLRDQIPRAQVLDLYAGTGAVGIEALSRGAAAATFVEHHRAVLDVLRDNLRVAGVQDRAAVHLADAAAFVARPAGGPFDVVFCDPPYDHPLPDVLRLVETLHAAGGLQRHAVVVIERDRRDRGLPLEDTASALLAVDRQRSYGDTVLLYLRTKDA